MVIHFSCHICEMIRFDSFKRNILQPAVRRAKVIMSCFNDTSPLVGYKCQVKQQALVTCYRGAERVGGTDGLEDRNK